MKNILVIIGFLLSAGASLQAMTSNILLPNEEKGCYNIPQLNLTETQSYQAGYEFTLHCDAKTQEIHVKSGTKQRVKILIYNENGVVVMASKVFTNTIKLDTEKLPDGNYYLVISTPVSSGIKSYSLEKK